MSKTATMFSSILCLACGTAAGGRSPFALTFSQYGITSLKRRDDPFATEFIARGSALGQVILRWRGEGKKWHEHLLCAQGAGAPAWKDHSSGKETSWVLKGAGKSALHVRERFVLRGEMLLWLLSVKNEGGEGIEVGDIGLPLPMNTVYPRITSEAVKAEIFRRRVFRHAFISGHGSFLFWLPVGGEGWFLVMRPVSGTKFEYFTEKNTHYAHGGKDYVVYIHSRCAGGSETRGTWRQTHTSLRLRPQEEKTYGCVFSWAESYRGVKETLYESGGFDIEVVPGMVLPVGTEARLCFRTKQKGFTILPEFPRKTELRFLGKRDIHTHLLGVRFLRYGENTLTVRWGRDCYLCCEFFVTKPLSVLIQKRARFIAERQQHRNPKVWYDGLFSLYDVRLPPGRSLLGPENLGGQPPYAVSGSDDPSNCKCLYLAEKNRVYPAKREIEALEYFARNFVWGKHQRTDREQPYPYGIYGAPSWYVNRFARRDPLTGGVSRPGGPSQCRMWRTFDYTTYFAFYYDMYRIAKADPHLTRYLDAAGYLERAYGTARAFFEVPYNIRMEGGWAFTGWTDWAYKIGNFHEKYLLGVVAALSEEGHKKKARYLTQQWEKKVKYFIYDDPYPFISEMPVDSTAYESTYVIAKYALQEGLAPDHKLWRDKNTGRWYSHPRIDPGRHREFLRRQLYANLACRGYLEKSYYHYGSDFRGCGSSFYCLSYMSQMGGWALVDCALRFEKDPAWLLRLGYASLLSSWACVNAAAGQCNEGCWYPESRHDGAAGWGFMPQKAGSEWNPAVKGIPRGPWPVDGEIDHGLAAYIEAACTVLYEDPLFGLCALGGELVSHTEPIAVIPKDGVRQRFSVLLGEKRLHLAFATDGFAQGKPITVSRDLARVSFAVESRFPRAHAAQLVVETVPQGCLEISIEGTRLLQEQGKTAKVQLRLPPHPNVVNCLIERKAPF